MSARDIIGSVFETALKIVLIVVAVILVYRFSVSAYQLGYRLFGEPPVSEEPGVTMKVTISAQDTEKQVAEALEQAGLIRDAKLFTLVEKLSGRTLQPGSYELTTAMTMDEMIEIMGVESESAAEEAEEGT